MEIRSVCWSPADVVAWFGPKAKSRSLGKIAWYCFAFACSKGGGGLGW